MLLFSIRLLYFCGYYMRRGCGNHRQVLIHYIIFVIYFNIRDRLKHKKRKTTFYVSIWLAFDVKFLFDWVQCFVCFNWNLTCQLTYNENTWIWINSCCPYSYFMSRACKDIIWYYLFISLNDAINLSQRCKEIFLFLSFTPLKFALN